MNTNRDDLTTYDMSAAAFEESAGNGMSDEEYAVWFEEEARREYETHLMVQADEEAAEADELARMEGDLTDLSDDDLADAAQEARVMFPDTPWGRLVIAAYEERVAERAEAEAR